MSKFSEKPYITLIDGQLTVVPARELFSKTQVAFRNDAIFHSEDKTIDWSKTDPFTESVNNAFELATKNIDSNVVLKTLLDKTDWNLQDRKVWEYGASHEIAKAIRAQPLFENYRSHRNGYSVNTSLNKMSLTSENDCTELSIVMAIVMQKIEDKYLNEGIGGLKQRSNYYCAGGRTYRDGDKLAGFHNYVVSEATAGVIEATKKEFPYQPNIDSYYTFAHFIAGYPIKTGFVCEDKEGFEDIFIYAPANFMGAADQFKVARQRLDLIEGGNMDGLSHLYTKLTLDDSAGKATVRDFSREVINNIKKGYILPSTLMSYNGKEVAHAQALIDEAQKTSFFSIDGDLVTKKELDQITGKLDKGSVRFVNNSGDCDFLIFNNIRFPLTFDRDVPENVPVNSK